MADVELDDVAPLTALRLPPRFRKHADPSAPTALRLMAAKGLVPLAPSDLCHCLAMLADDPDRKVSATALATARKLPARILDVALRDETHNPRVLHVFAKLFDGNDYALERIVRNRATHDRTLADIASRAEGPRIIGLIASVRKPGQS